MSKTLAVQFTYFIGGKKLTIFNRSSVGAMIHGICTHPALKTEVETVFLVIDKCPTPLPIVETEAQVFELLDKLSNKETT